MELGRILANQYIQNTLNKTNIIYQTSLFVLSGLETLHKVYIIEG